MSARPDSLQPLIAPVRAETILESGTVSDARASSVEIKEEAPSSSLTRDRGGPGLDAFSQKGGNRAAAG
jgi:hypothetical protein